MSRFLYFFIALYHFCFILRRNPSFFFFFLNDTAPPEIYPLPLPAPFPIYWRGGMPQQLAQPPPAAWRGTVDRGAHAGSAEPEESFRGRIVVPRDERNRRNGRKLAHKPGRSEEHTSELQSQSNLVCRLLLEK